MDALARNTTTLTTPEIPEEILELATRLKGDGPLTAAALGLQRGTDTHGSSSLARSLARRSISSFGFHVVRVGEVTR